MADRQEIDALIVGALYGELDAADRARLETHLSSHPEDRAALEALERTRATVRRGLADLPAAEPNPAISTLLLREAGRLAPSPGRAAAASEPAETEGLWSRFLRWARPVAMHPAFAGAAALLLVAGTATALWVQGKGGVTEPEAPYAAAPAGSTEKSAETRPEPPAAPPPADSPAPMVAAGDSDGIAVDLEADGKPAALDEGEGRAKLDDSRERERSAASAGKAKRKSKATAPGYIDVAPSTDSIDIKEMPAKQAKDKGGDAFAEADEELALELRDDAATSRGAKVSGSAGGGMAPAPEPKTAKPTDPKLEEWAQGAHARLTKLVADGKCPEAGRLGAEIKDRAPEYYAAKVANDRGIRACKSYIEGQAKKKAEKDYKSRSQSNSYDEAADSK